MREAEWEVKKLETLARSEPRTVPRAPAAGAGPESGATPATPPTAPTPPAQLAEPAQHGEPPAPTGESTGAAS
jgi:hypothetical protein